ncbi:hypothetical protein IEN85_13130 [Pelagicoccus sp. NFK12]|uniref:Uncharacterized protein n=1 Tax=Pelagicoccus enzymogenes TaxID=2773457 RepID=A0A927F8I4_9BACT|nr:hypothetical protein [Pelagicoccus enzymogenes]MBD5780437.1 hypothetical protein [Pelagicoccus enzymogenes]
MRRKSDGSSAFCQLVLYAIEACSNLSEMYVAAGKNDHYAERIPLGFSAQRLE